MSKKNTDFYFLKGGGEMGELIRAKDWSKTSLGDPANWPQSLCTMVAVMLDNPFGMYIAWGSEYIQLYNDGYRPILGVTKHPQALGISTRETFSEIWHIIESMFDGVMKGKAVGFPDFMLPLNRYGYEEECYFDFSYSPIRKDDGEVGGILVTVIETTEKKRATEALKESNARFLNNIMQAPVAMCIFRGENYVVEIANEQMLTLWGKQADQVMNKPIFEGLPEAKNQGLEPLLDKVFTTGEKFVANERPVKLPRNGNLETTYVNFVYEALKAADGNISGIVAIAIEVTPQVTARSKVEESEQKIRALVANAPFPIAVYVGKEMTVELANQSIIDIWGKGNDVIGKSFKEVLPELDNQLVFAQIEKVLITGESFHTKNTPLDLIVDGKLRTYYFNYSFTPLYDVAGNIYGVMNTGVDLTELNIAKRRIEESDKRFRDTMKQAPVGITILRGPQYIVEMANDAYLQLVDKKECDFVGKSLFTSLPEVEESVHSLLDNVLNTGIPYHGNEVPVPVNRYGKQDIFYFDFLWHPLKEEDGKISGVIAIVTEVTEKVEARKKVEDSEKRYNLMLMQSPFAFLILKGKDLVVHLANESMKEVLGKGANIEGKPLLEVLPEIKGQAFPDLLDNVYSTGIPISANEMLAKLTRNGKLEDVYFNYVYQPYYEADNTISGVTVIAYDVTSSVIANKKIEENEQRLNIVVEASELGTWELDLKTMIPQYSQQYLQIIGGYKSYVELTHQQLEQHLYPDDMHIREKAFKQAIATGYLHYKARVIWTDKSIHWMEGKGKVFYDAENKPEKMIGTIRDTTAEKKHQQELEDSEQRFRNLILQSPVAKAILKGKEHIVEMANEALLKDIWRKNESDVIGKKILEVFPELKKQKYSKLLDDVFTTGKKHTEKEALISLNGNDGLRNYYVDFEYAPVFSGDDKISGIKITAVDVTEKVEARKKIEESEERFRSLAQTLPQLTWVTDEKGNAEFASSRWKEYSGIEPGGEKEWKAIVHPEDYDNINAAWLHSLATGKIYRFDVRLKSKEGEYRWHNMNGEAVLDKENKIVKWVGAFTDIHAQKIKEEKKDEFISIASHEMKTPLTTAKAYLQMLELSLDENDEDSNLFAKKASQSVNRLNELVSELLDVSKIRLGKLNYTITTFNFNEMIESTVENVQLTSQTHNIIKTGKVSDVVIGDKDRLQQVVINLLNNAIKYSPSAEKVFITVEQEKNTIKVSVRDTGIGMSRQSLNKIFEKYHRIEEHAVHFQGLGIGLFISYEIIQRHHGKLWAESETGKGSTFYFTIPLDITSPQ